MGQRRRSRGREINGVLLLDKPIGYTSNGALQRVKYLFQARKAGHTGSLDPLASGMLPICFGHATKLSAFLLDADKRYVVRARLGVKTDTADADGKVIATAPVPTLSPPSIEATLAHFVGDIEQMPPMYSALKHQGRRLYELARQGVEVERERRPVHVHALELRCLGDDELELDVRCSKGTYVRTLVEDVADALGTVAHVTALRRLAVGPYEDAAMHTLEELEAVSAEGGSDALDGLLLPLDSAIAHWPSLRLGADSAFYLRNGQPVQVPRAPTCGLVRLYGEDSSFIGMGQITDDGRVAPKRLFQ
jgi:tRNA pseudouridine55 synthase